MEKFERIYFFKNTYTYIYMKAHLSKVSRVYQSRFLEIVLQLPAVINNIPIKVIRPRYRVMLPTPTVHRTRPAVRHQDWEKFKLINLLQNNGGALTRKYPNHLPPTCLLQNVVLIIIQHKHIHTVKTYLGMYKTRSATTKPTVTNKLVAGRNGTTSKRNPSTNGM